MPRLAFIVLTLALGLGCGSKTGLVDDHEGPDGGTTDGGTTDAWPPLDCPRLAWDACEPTAERVLVSGSDLGQSPDVAFTGSDLLVVYDGHGGNGLALVSLDGAIESVEPLGGIQVPRIAWHPTLEVGLVVADSVLQWVDGRGLPVGELQRMDFDGWQLEGDLAPVPGGFVLLSGAMAYSSPPPLYWMRLGPEPEPFAWELLHEGGPRAAAEHAVGPDGLLRWAVSTAWYRDLGELYRHDGSGGLAEELALGGLLPAGGIGFPVGLAELDGRLYVLWGSSPSAPPGTWSQWMLESDGETTREWRLDRSHNGSDGHLIVLGGELVVMASAIHPSHQVSLAAFDPEAAEPLGELVVLGGDGVISHSPRMTLTDRGIATVWSELTGDTDGMSTLLQVFDCCVD